MLARTAKTRHPDLWRGFFVPVPSAHIGPVFCGSPPKLQGGRTASLQGKKRNPNPNFLIQIFSGRVGVFHVKGWGPKSSVCPSKPRETKLFRRDIPRFCLDIPGVPEKFEKKSLCSILVPYLSTLASMLGLQKRELVEKGGLVERVDLLEISEILRKPPACERARRL